MDIDGRGWAAACDWRALGGYEKGELLMQGKALLVVFSLLLSGCSVGMAASGNKEQDASIIFPGSNRAVIMSKLGPPDTSRVLEDGKTEDTYLIKQGNEAIEFRIKNGTASLI